jgi:hypothetical protein
MEIADRQKIIAENKMVAALCSRLPCQANETKTEF